ncbi:unnamed protein product [Rotaria socialis]|uniref:Uncharacterized protein n=1 Tax=Rotaria socialis TaxID=392032 RepID=A0A820G1G1_9BILA|nr:unnamed protein product [Rotaria socialis]CAF4270302.1 unnamed protein product [Rotaria socialis]
MAILSIPTVFPEEIQSPTFDRTRTSLKLVDPMDNDQSLPIMQTTVLRIVPRFKIIATIDEPTKVFYQNKSQMKSSSSPELIKETGTTQQITSAEDFDREPSASSVSQKLILKTSRDRDERSKPKIYESSISCGSSLPSSNMKQKPSTRLDFNQVQYLAEVTAKRSSSLSNTRSLFDQTFNIFDPNGFFEIVSINSHSPQFQHYIKPMRYEPNAPNANNKQTSRLYSQNRLRQKSSKSTDSYTVPDEYNRVNKQHLNKNRHTSWSPIRKYTNQRRDYTPTINKRKENSSLLPSRSPVSLVKPHLENSFSKKPVRSPHHISRLSQYSSTLPVSGQSLTSVTSALQENDKKQDNESISKSDLPDTIHQEEHDETIQRYDRLLKKMRSTDEQLRSSSQAWISNIPQKLRIKMDRRSSSSVNKIQNNGHYFSPIIIQISFIIMVIFSLLFVYFFHEINRWCSEYPASAALMFEQHDDDTSNF